MTLKIETRRSGTSLIVQLIGELDVEHLDEVKAQVNDAACPVVVDVGELALISVEGIRFSTPVRTMARRSSMRRAISPNG
jgi:hypothetical protein